MVGNNRGQLSMDTNNAHEGEYPAHRYPPHWQHFKASDYETQKHPYVTCSYCGSVSCSDLLIMLQAGARLKMTDWKYGYPHKFYVNGIANELAGQTIQIGSRSANGVSTPLMGAASTHCFLKFYISHLANDCPEAIFAELTRLIAEQIRVTFTMQLDGSVTRLHYRYETPSLTPSKA